MDRQRSRGDTTGKDNKLHSHGETTLFMSLRDSMVKDGLREQSQGTKGPVSESSRKISVSV